MRGVHRFQKYPLLIIRNFLVLCSHDTACPTVVCLEGIGVAWMTCRWFLFDLIDWVVFAPPWRGGSKRGCNMTNKATIARSRLFCYCARFVTIAGRHQPPLRLEAQRAGGAAPRTGNRELRRARRAGPGAGKRQWLRLFGSCCLAIPSNGSRSKRYPVPHSLPCPLIWWDQMFVIRFWCHLFVPRNRTLKTPRALSGLTFHL